MTGSFPASRSRSTVGTCSRRRSCQGTPTVHGTRAPQSNFAQRKPATTSTRALRCSKCAQPGRICGVSEGVLECRRSRHSHDCGGSSSSVSGPHKHQRPHVFGWKTSCCSKGSEHRQAQAKTWQCWGHFRVLEPTVVQRRGAQLGTGPQSASSACPAGLGKGSKRRAP